MFNLSKNRKKFFLTALVGVFLFAGFLFVVPTELNAQSEIYKQTQAFAGEQGAGIDNVRDPRLIASLVIRFLLGFLSILFLAYMLYGGFMMMTSAGEEEKMNTGKTTIRRAIIGLIIILSSWGLTLLITRIAIGDPYDLGNKDCVYVREQDGWFFISYFDIEEDRRRFFRQTDEFAPDLPDIKYSPCTPDE